MVSMLAFGPKVRGSYLVEAMDKNQQHAFLRRESRTVCPM
jgi:hypothetical protein